MKTPMRLPVVVVRAPACQNEARSWVRISSGASLFSSSILSEHRKVQGDSLWRSWMNENRQSLIKFRFNEEKKEYFHFSRTLLEQMCLEKVAQATLVTFILEM